MMLAILVFPEQARDTSRIEVAHRTLAALAKVASIIAGRIGTTGSRRVI